MKSYPNTNNWKFKKLHKPNESFKYLVERKMFISMDCEYAIQAMEPGKITYKQIESCRRALRRGLGKTSRILFKIFPSVPVSQKSIASRMGKVKAHYRIG